MTLRRAGATVFLMVLVLLALYYLFRVDGSQPFRYPRSEDLASACQQLEPMQLDESSEKFSEEHLIQVTSRLRDAKSGARPDVESLLRCPIQQYRNGGVTYDLAFVEFDEEGGLRAPGQMEALARHIARHKRLNVVLFVHGWRNDADIGSDDVRRFHSLISLSANYSRQRSANSESTVPTLGIFFAWRGRSVREPGIDGLADVWALPTFWSRKSRSDALAAPIGRRILEVEQWIQDGRTSAADPTDRRMTIVGHSLGGNIVLRGLKDEIDRRIGSTAPRKRIAGVGDMVVLINPASEASEFHPLQSSVRRFIGIKESSVGIHSFLDAKSDECQHGDFSSATEFTEAECMSSGTSKRFASDQVPILMSITAAKYYRHLSPDAARWDSAVGKYLPTLLRVAGSGVRSREEIVSVGNHLPIRAHPDQSTAQVTKRPGTDHEIQKAQAHEVFGISHEIESDLGPGVSTSYRFAGASATEDHAYPACAPESSYSNWLNAAIGNSGHAHGREWNTTFSMPGAGEGKSSVRVNVVHGAARHTCRSKFSSDGRCADMAMDSGARLQKEYKYSIPTLGEGRDPIWNVGAHPNVVESHGGYISHTLWCVLSRFVLDRPGQSFVTSKSGPRRLGT